MHYNSFINSFIMNNKFVYYPYFLLVINSASSFLILHTKYTEGIELKIKVISCT